MSYWVGLLVTFAVYLITKDAFGLSEDAAFGAGLLCGVIAYGMTWAVRFIMVRKYGEDIFEDEL